MHYFFVRIFYGIVLYGSLSFDGIPQKNNTSLPKLEILTEEYSEAIAKNLLDYFNSLYPKNKLKLYQNYTNKDWVTILSFQYKSAVASKNTKIAAQLARALAIIHHRKTNFEEAIPYLEFAIEKNSDLEEVQYKNMLERLEFSYSFLGNYKEAILIRKERIEQGFSNSFWELYEAFGMYTEAIKEFTSFERNDFNTDFQKIRYHNKLGKLFLKNTQIDSARYHFKQMENQADYIINNDNYTVKNEYTEFVKVYFKNLAISQQGECLLAEHKYQSALPLLQKVIPYCKKINEVDQKLYKWMSIAKCYNALNTPKEAIAYLKKIKKSLKNKRILSLELDWFKQYAIANKLSNKWSQHNTFMTRYFDLKDSISFQNQKNSALLLLAEYDLTQKKELLLNEKEKTNLLEKDATNQKRIILLIITVSFALLLIVFLVYSNYIQQKKAKEELEISNVSLSQFAKNEAEISAKNEFLLQEMHHRIKNNLQMISSLLSLQNNTLQNPESKRALNDSKTRIKTMSLVHQQLYQNDKLESIVALKDYLEEIVKNLIASYTLHAKFTITIDTPFSVAVDTAINIGLMVNEALTNTIKYNTNTNLLFSVTLKATETDYLLTILDTGKGFNNQGQKGFGLQLITILVKQLKGKATLTTAVEKGVQHHIVIPKDLIV